MVRGPKRDCLQTRFHSSIRGVVAHVLCALERIVREQMELNADAAQLLAKCPLSIFSIRSMNHANVGDNTQVTVSECFDKFMEMTRIFERRRIILGAILEIVE